jgi:hypothetical protein
MRRAIVHPGQKVVTTEGKTEIVAAIFHGIVYVYGPDGWLRSVRVVGDAWGGEHDQEIGLAA